MYNPCRGGVRGGADQFTWESVKSDKHRENYLGHSLKAPVGRWQKGKDLSWYAKERKDGEDASKTKNAELSAVKKAEEEAMLIALGHNVVKRETQNLTKEEINEALRRNTIERDKLDIERIDGLGATGNRAALLSGISKSSKPNKEGVTFERPRDRVAEKKYSENTQREQSPVSKRKKSKKSTKKHKKDKKRKKSKKHDDSSSTEDSDSETETYQNRSKNKQAVSDRTRCKSPKPKKHKKKHNYCSSDSETDTHARSRNKRTHTKHNIVKRRHDTSESD